MRMILKNEKTIDVIETHDTLFFFNPEFLRKMRASENNIQS